MRRCTVLYRGSTWLRTTPVSSLTLWRRRAAAQGIVHMLLKNARSAHHIGVHSNAGCDVLQIILPNQTRAVGTQVCYSPPFKKHTVDIPCSGA